MHLYQAHNLADKTTVDFFTYCTGTRTYLVRFAKLQALSGSDANETTHGNNSY